MEDYEWRTMNVEDFECGPISRKSTIEHYPSGSVIARVLFTANPSVYTTMHESIAQRWREKEMIEAHPFV